MASINFGKKKIEYQIKRGKRKKTIAISILADAQITVRAPSSISNEEIGKIIKKKARWILEKQEQTRRQTDQFPKKEFVSGEQILYLGRKYRLKVEMIDQNYAIMLQLEGRKMHIAIPLNFDAEESKRIIRDALIKWYCKQAEQIIKERVNYFSMLLDVAPKKIIIKEQQRRWGSCSNSGILRFNWRAIIAPISIIDYIIVHELCHLKVKNHSADFWRMVSLVIPDYKKRREWLRNNSGSFKI